MDILLITFTLVAFLAVVLSLEGVYHYWASKKSAEVLRIQERLSTLEYVDPEGLSLERREKSGRSALVERWLRATHRGRRLVQYVESAGTESTAGDMLMLSAALAGIGVMGTLIIGRPLVLGLAIGIILANIPWWKLARQRHQRIELLDRQFPEALDLMSRALRAGHAFPVAVRMCADEMPLPMSREFRLLADETNYGVPLPDALQNMARRMPVADIGYFVVAVIIQRESGGNLTELLDNISALIRQRMKLRGQIRTMTAEGRMSAWVLTFLPIGAAVLLSLLNPGQMNVLWTDPSGQRMVWASGIMMVLGILWMRKLIQVRV